MKIFHVLLCGHFNKNKVFDSFGLCVCVLLVMNRCECVIFGSVSFSLSLSPNISFVVVVVWFIFFSFVLFNHNACVCVCDWFPRIWIGCEWMHMMVCVVSALCQLYLPHIFLHFVSFIASFSIRLNSPSQFAALNIFLVCLLYFAPWHNWYLTQCLGI